MAEPTGGSSFGDETTEINSIPRGGAAEAIADAPAEVEESEQIAEDAGSLTDDNLTLEDSDGGGVMPIPAEQSAEKVEEKKAPEKLEKLDPKDASQEMKERLYRDKVTAAKLVAGDASRLISAIKNLPDGDLNTVVKEQVLVEKIPFVTNGERTPESYNEKYLAESDIVAIADAKDPNTILHAGVLEKNPSTGKWQIIEKRGSNPARVVNFEDYTYGEGTMALGNKQKDTVFLYYKVPKKPNLPNS